MTRTLWPALLAVCCLASCGRPGPSADAGKPPEAEPAKPAPAAAEKKPAEEKPPAKDAARPGPYVATIIFHLKKDAPAGEADALVADGKALLKGVPTVRDFQMGRRAEKAPGAADRSIRMVSPAPATAR